MPVSPAKLSTIIITKNSAATLAACLESVQTIAAEIIVVDSGSTDDTINIAKRFTTKVYHADWQGYGVQKNRALAYATCPWILTIDSDEILSPECAAAIQQTLSNPAYDAYRIRMFMVFAGKTLRHGNSVKYFLRLFKKSAGKFSDSTVHESVIINTPSGKIDAPILHYSYLNLSAWIQKMNLYTDISLSNDNRNYCSITKASLKSFYTFVKMFVFKRGFLDGRLGFVMAINAAVSNYYKYLKIALNDHFTLPPIKHSPDKSQ